MAKQKETTKESVESVEEQSSNIIPDLEESSVNKSKVKKEYKLLSFTSPDNLQAACNNALADGWSFVGGICVSHVTTPTSVTTLYTQAIFKILV